MSPDTALFDVFRPGEWVSEHTQKSQMVFSRVTVHHGEKPGAPFHILSRGSLCQGSLAGAREAGRHKINGFLGRGDPPVTPWAWLCEA